MMEQWWTNEIDRRHLYDALTDEIFTEFASHIAAGDAEGHRAWQLANAIKVALQLPADPEWSTGVVDSMQKAIVRVESANEPGEQKEGLPMVVMSTCQCEHVFHKITCQNVTEMTINTIYGKFDICAQCHKDHPYPQEYLKS